MDKRECNGILYDSRSILNRIKIAFARSVIFGIRLFMYLIRKGKIIDLSTKQHYYIMRLFRIFFNNYYTWIKYPNPISPKNEIVLLVDLCENSQQWYFRLKGDYDKLELEILSTAMKHADCFLDVGANIGVYGITIAQAFPEKIIEMFEPLNKNFNSLNKNICANQLKNCVGNFGAVSVSQDPLRFYVNPIHDGGGSLIEPTVYKTGDIEISVEDFRIKNPYFEPYVEVPTFVIDKLISKKCVVKVDVEGAEIDVLKSCEESLKNRLIDMLLVEVQADTIDDAVRILEANGFVSFLLPDFSTVTVGTVLPWFVRNIVSVRTGTAIHAYIQKVVGEKGI